MTHHKNIPFGPIEAYFDEMHEDLRGNPESAEDIGDLTEIFEVSPNPFIRCDESGRIIYANGASGFKGSGRVKAEALPEFLLQACLRVIKTKSSQVCEAEHDFQKYLYVMVPFQNCNYVNIHGKSLDRDYRTENERLKNTIAEYEKQNRRLTEQLQETRTAHSFSACCSGKGMEKPPLPLSLQIMQELSESAINSLCTITGRFQKALSTKHLLLRGKS